ncbi:MAG TPA: tetratricopeptide repeat protein [Kofleriaceae bacterium]|nr:tetratricopeptide repeat protein [Kofleriaceae bacterium]
MGVPVGGCLAPEAALGFVAGTLDPGASDQVEDHLDSCAECRALVAALVRGRAPAPRDEVSGLEETQAQESAPTAVDLVSPRRSDAGHPAPGTRIDRYVIERPLGAGGMGAVSLADDPELKRKVCLKLLRPELLDPGDTQATRARLLREAQAMAQISHANVVAVFDIGTYEGKVFIAMEYIEGWDLAQWLRLEPRAADTVLDVFRAAGRGLAAAHRAGLVHRDFKPQNVMIGSDGSVKVTDFGLARAELLTDARVTVEVPDEPRAPRQRAGSAPDSLLDSPLTRTGALVGTPAYMAPEQVSGEAIDARCDQFAFAVALHEALSGERPFAGSSLTEIFAATVEERVRPIPKRAGVPRRMRAAIARGLRASPSDRFPTMDAMLAALSPRGSRRVALAAAAALVAIGGGSVVATALLRTPDAHAALCDGGGDLVAAVWGDGPRQRIQAAFVATGLRLAASSSSLIMRELDGYADEWAAAHREACVATRVREEQTEAMMALRMTCLERRRAELAATVEILERPDARLIDSAFLLPANLSAVEDCADAEALAAPVPLPRNPAQREQIASVRGQLARAKALAEAQRFDRAREVTGPAVAAAERLGWAPLVAEARLSAAGVDLQQGRHEEAEKGFHSAALAAEQSGHDQVRGEAYLGLLEASEILGRYDEALRWAGYARATIERAGSQTGLLGKLAVLLGDVHADKGDKAGAIAQYRAAIDILSREGAHSSDAAWARFQLGHYYFRVREFEKAMVEFGETLATWRQIGGDDHPLALLTLQTMSDTRREQGRPADALALGERAVAAFRRVYGDDHESTASAYNSLGMALSDLGRVEEGLASQERALEIYRRVLGRDHFYVAGHLGTIARTLVSAGRLDDAAARAEEAIAIASAHDLGGDVLTYRNLLGTVLTKAKKYGPAIAELERALAAAEKLLAADAPQLADTLTRLGTAHLRSGAAREAVAVLERALAIRTKGNASPWESSWTKLELARALWDAGRDRARARTLASESRAEAEAAADAEQARAAVEWLAAHGPAPPK